MTKTKKMFMKHQPDPFEEYRTELNEQYEGIQKKYQLLRMYVSGKFMDWGNLDI